MKTHSQDFLANATASAKLQTRGDDAPQAREKILLVSSEHVSQMPASRLAQLTSLVKSTNSVRSCEESDLGMNSARLAGWPRANDSILLSPWLGRAFSVRSGYVGFTFSSLPLLTAASLPIMRPL